MHRNPKKHANACLYPDCNRSGVCDYTTGHLPKNRGVISVYDFSNPRPPDFGGFLFNQKQKG